MLKTASSVIATMTRDLTELSNFILKFLHDLYKPTNCQTLTQSTKISDILGCWLNVLIGMRNLPIAKSTSKIFTQKEMIKDNSPCQCFFK